MRMIAAMLFSLRRVLAAILARVTLQQTAPPGRLRKLPGRPASKLGDAMGLSSTLMRREPSLGRSGNGGSRAAVTTVMTRVSPIVRITPLSSGANCK